MLPVYRRHLPHEHPPGADLLLTWNLHGALPRDRFPAPTNLNAGKAFVWMDRYLDQARTGPVFLKQEAIAGMVVDSLH